MRNSLKLVTLAIILVLPVRRSDAQADGAAPDAVQVLESVPELDLQIRGVAISCETVLAFGSRFDIALPCASEGYIGPHELGHALLDVLDEYSEGGFDDPEVRTRYVAIISELGWTIKEGLLAVRCPLCER